MEDFCKSWLDLNRAEEYDIIKKAKEKDAEAIEIVLDGVKNLKDFKGIFSRMKL